MLAACIGGANWDIKARASSQVIRGSSTPGVVTRTPGGIARNVAENLARLGVDVALVTIIGNDTDGDDLVSHSKDCGFRLSNALSLDKPTGTYVSLHDASGEMLHAVNDMRIIDDLSLEAVIELCQLLPAADCVFVDCNLPSPTLDGLRWINERTVVDAVSVEKAEKLVEIGLDQFHIVIANELQSEVLKRARGKPQHMVTTLGSRGALINGTHVPACAIAEKVIDVTGAGDAATAGLLFGLFEFSGISIVEAARLGQAAAAITAEDARSVSPNLTCDALFSRAGMCIPGQ